MTRIAPILQPHSAKANGRAGFNLNGGTKVEASFPVNSGIYERQMPLRLSFPYPQSRETYSLRRATNLSHGFTPLATNLPATAPQNQFTDSSATHTGHLFYRIEVSP